MARINSATDAGTAVATADSASSLAKMLHILQLFSETEPVWSPPALIEALETSRSTGYRYIKALHDAGLLSTASNGHYRLGPRVIEMDLQIRLTDPLLLASHGVLEDLVDRIGHSALLCTAYRDSVLCVGECRAPDSPANRFSRGQRRPLFQGAISKVILAHLPHHRLKAIYPRQHAEIERAGLGSTWSDFRANLGKIKKAGYALTYGEFNPGVYGVAAPILTDQKTAWSSVGVAWDKEARRDVDVEHAVLAVKQAAATISERMLKSENRVFGRGDSDGANDGVNKGENDASAGEARGMQ
jgi:DNA-binding IclR family transcriptional regulator